MSGHVATSGGNLATPSRAHSSQHGMTVVRLAGVEPATLATDANAKSRRFAGSFSARECKTLDTMS
jgi:hypothetical protein